MESTSKTYFNYQAMLSQVNESMADLGDVCDELGLKEYADSLKTSREHMKNRVFSVGVMGEFRRGKSTVINALLGRDIVPSDIVPTSATLNYIRWDAAPRADIIFKDGTSKEVPVDDLSKYITKITKESEEIAATVDRSVVYYPCPFCQNGVEIVDTPGLNDDERMTAISEQVIPTLDAIIMVLVPDSPFSQSEAEFVRTKVMTSDLGRIIFVVNKIDNIRPKERPRLLAHIKEKIEASVLAKMAEMYGEDSREYQDAQTKIGGIRLYPISARDALEGKLDNDYELLEKSGMPDFEAVLSKLLTEERGMLELISPVNSILSIAKEAEHTIHMRMDAMQMETEEFEKVQKEAIEKIKKGRETKKKEIEAVKARAGSLYNDLLPQVNAGYAAVEEQLQSYIDHFTITKDDVKDKTTTEATADRFVKGAEQEAMSLLSACTEKMEVEIQNRVGDEIVEISKFAQELSEDLAKTQMKITKKDSGSMFDWGVVAVDALTNGVGLIGIGGVLSGFKENGLPGALVGGGVGFLAGYSAYIATSVVGIALGLTGGALILPVIVASGMVSTFAGKGAVKKLFGKNREKEIAALRAELHKYVDQYMVDLRMKRPLETWLRDTTNTTYKAVAEQLNQDVESTLLSMENNLTRIKLDLQKNATQRRQILSDMERLGQTLQDVCAKITPVKERLASALNYQPQENAG